MVVRDERIKHCEFPLLLLGVLILHPELGKKALEKLTEDEFNTSLTKKVFRVLRPHFESGTEVILSANEELTVEEQSAVSRYVAARLQLQRNDETVLMSDIATLLSKNEKRKLERKAETDIDALGEYLNRIKEMKK